MNIWGWLMVLGAVGGSVGFTIYGMGTSTLARDAQLVNYGLILLIAGLIALAVGFVAHRATDRSTES